MCLVFAFEFLIAACAIRILWVPYEQEEHRLSQLLRSYRDWQKLTLWPFGILVGHISPMAEQPCAPSAASCVFLLRKWASLSETSWEFTCMELCMVTFHREHSWWDPWLGSPTLQLRLKGMCFKKDPYLNKVENGWKAAFFKEWLGLHASFR